MTTPSSVVRVVWRRQRSQSVKPATSKRKQELNKEASLRDIKKGKEMKYIVAIIQPGKVEAVYNALLEIGVSGLTTTEVHGYGRQKGKTEMYRGAEYTVNFLPKMKIEVAVSSKMAGEVVAAIKTASESGKIGDGKIFTLDLADAMRIRTGETGAEAL